MTGKQLPPVLITVPFNIRISRVIGEAMFRGKPEDSPSHQISAVFRYKEQASGLGQVREV